MAYGTADEALSLFWWLKIGLEKLARTGTSLSTSLNRKKTAALYKSQ